jgi:hypothetical protein
VIKSADLRDRNDAPARWRLYFARMGAVVVEGLMRAGGVVVREVTVQQTSEMPFVDHDDVIEAFPVESIRWRSAKLSLQACRVVQTQSRHAEWS